MKPIKYIFAALPLAVLLAFAAFCSYSASPNSGYAYSVLSRNAAKLSEDTVVYELTPTDSTENWDGGDSELEIVTVSGEDKLRANARDGKAVSLRYDFHPDYPMNLVYFREMIIAMRANAASDSVDVTFTYRTDDRKYSYSAVIPAGKNTVLYHTLTDIPDRTAFYSLEITVRCSDDSLTSVVLDYCRASTGNITERIEKYSSPAFSASLAEPEYSEEGVTLTLGEDGDTVLGGIALADPYAPGSSGIYLDISCTDATFLNITLESSNRSDSSLSATLKPGNSRYYFPYEPAVYDTVKLDFTPLHGSSSVTLHGLSFHKTEITLPEKFEYNESVSRKCTVDREKNELVLQGSMPGSTVIEFINHSLNLCLIPPDASPSDQAKFIEIGEFSASTKFEFRLPLDSLPYNYAECRIALSVRDGDSIKILTDPCYIDFTDDTSPRPSSPIGLHGASTSDAFAANASHAIVDISLERLTGGGELLTEGRLITRGGSYYYLDKQYIDGLDREIKFYVSAGISVYLRFKAEDGIAGIERYRDGDMFAFTVPSGSETDNLILAVIDYLTERYSTVSGLIIGGCGDGDYSGDIGKYSLSLARLLISAYTTAAANIPSVSVYTSFSSPTPDSFIAASAISLFIDSLGNINWSILAVSYEGGYSELCHAETFFETVSGYAGSTAKSIIFLWIPSSDGILEEYERISEHTADSAINASILSVAELGDTSGLFDGIKLILNGEGQRQTEQYSASSEPYAFAGTCALWDFRRAYSTLGWITGGGFSSINTQQTDGGLRCLTAEMNASAEQYSAAVNGLVLCMMDKSLDLTAAPYVAIEFEVLCEADLADIVFILGSGDIRAEFSAVAENGKTVTAYCDLSSFTMLDSIDFVAVNLSGCTAATKLQLYGISLCSPDKTDGELKELYQSDSSDGETEKNSSLADAYALSFVIGVALLSLLVVALLSRDSGSEKQVK